MRVKIEKLVYGGEGLAHDSGATVFVPFVLPGEEVEIEAVEQKKKFIRGRLERVSITSPDRIAPKCHHFGVCGGCNYQHIPYESQLRYKEEILRETLRRLGRLDWNQPITIHPSPPWEYRNRAQWKIRSADEAARESQREFNKKTTVRIGYFHAGSSILCPVSECPILSPKLSATLSALREALAENALPHTLREVEAFVDSEDRELLLNVTTTSLKDGTEQLAKELSDRIANLASLLLQDATGQQMKLHGPGFLEYKTLGRQFRVGHLSFFQVNRFLLEELAKTAVTFAGSGELAFDLYSGVGLFTSYLADNFKRVETSEADPAAARDLEANASQFGENILTRNLSTEDFLNQWTRKRIPKAPDAVVIDPPRAGLEPQALRQLMAVAPSRVVYVSCDPSKLARDLAQLCARMYKVQDIHLFDMFPQTYHIETLVHLERAP